MRYISESIFVKLFRMNCPLSYNWVVVSSDLMINLKMMIISSNIVLIISIRMSINSNTVLMISISMMITVLRASPPLLPIHQVVAVHTAARHRLKHFVNQAYHHLFIHLPPPLDLPTSSSTTTSSLSTSIHPHCLPVQPLLLLLMLLITPI